VRKTRAKILVLDQPDAFEIEQMRAASRQSNRQPRATSSKIAVIASGTALIQSSRTEGSGRRTAAPRSEFRQRLLSLSDACGS
jgi:hypothetical protein